MPVLTGDDATIRTRARERLRVTLAPNPIAIPGSVEEFLTWLGGPTAIRVAGRDRGRSRAVSTLVHGNEPSGVRAVHRWLLGGPVPAVDVLVVVTSVEAALAPPGFANRALPGHSDLNRCFLGPFSGPEGELARQLLDLLRAERPEAMIDLHNNTGHNPPYGVGPSAGAIERGLAGLFGERFVESQLRLGALVEAMCGEFPSVTIECGRSGDERADEVAFEGLQRFVELERLDAAGERAPEVKLLCDPIRVVLRVGLRLEFAEAAGSDADLTLASDVDRHNFAVLPPHSALGWARPGIGWPFEAHDLDGHEVSRAFFSIEDGVVRTLRSVIPIMMTTNAAVAASDCLFYLVRPG